MKYLIEISILVSLIVGSLADRERPGQKSKPKPAPKEGISLKEYQRQVDIFKKSIDLLKKKLLSQDALMQGLKADVSDVDGRVDGLTGHVDTLENTVVGKCSHHSDCAAPLRYCIDGWCSIAECTKRSDCRRGEFCYTSYDGGCYDEHDDFPGYNFLESKYCFKGLISKYDTLQDAIANCKGGCGCIHRDSCNRGPYLTYASNSTGTSSYRTCTWVKPR